MNSGRTRWTVLFPSPFQIYSFQRHNKQLAFCYNNNITNRIQHKKNESKKRKHVNPSRIPYNLKFSIRFFLSISEQR